MNEKEVCFLLRKLKNKIIHRETYRRFKIHDLSETPLPIRGKKKPNER